MPQRSQVPPAESGDRPIVRGRPRGQPPKAHIIDAFAFDHPRRAHPDDVAVQQDSYHQPRITGGAPRSLALAARIRTRSKCSSTNTAMNRARRSAANQSSSDGGNRSLIRANTRSLVRQATSVSRNACLPAVQDLPRTIHHHRVHRPPIMPCTLPQPITPPGVLPTRRCRSARRRARRDPRLGGAGQAQAVGRGTASTPTRARC